MKHIWIMTIFMTAAGLTARINNVESGVYHWSGPEKEKNSEPVMRPVLEGRTPALDLLKVTAVTLPAEAAQEAFTLEDSAETLIIVKNGEVHVRMDKEDQRIGPRSVVMIMPEDMCKVRNAGAAPAELYVIQFRTGKSADFERADSAGGSFVVNYNNLEFKPHDKGGLRNYYHRPTALFHDTEMHVTTLNPNIRSHEPHTHPQAEFVLIIKGNTAMQIGERICQAETGDLYYLETGVPHAIQNAGNEPCMYFAIQWE